VAFLYSGGGGRLGGEREGEEDEEGEEWISWTGARDGGTAREARLGLDDLRGLGQLLTLLAL